MTNDPLSIIDLSQKSSPAHLTPWLYILDLVGFRARGKTLRVLEIGSWEGISARFILDTIQEAQITCVDTWQGADEHKDGSAADLTLLQNIEKRFDENLRPYSNRVRKFRGMSSRFFQDSIEGDDGGYDLIYVDGSHYVDDVYLDAISSFKLLKSGGVMVFDDYYFVYYPKRIENPAFAINNFLRVYDGRYKMLLLSRQVFIQKTS
jgi:predicted O-methyltransferase YrrM